MSYFVLKDEGVYPIAPIKKTHCENLEKSLWIDGNPINFNVQEPIFYDLDPKRPGKVKMLYCSPPVPVMHISLLEALLYAGVDNLQVFRAVIRDLNNGVDYEDYKAFNIVGKVAAADMQKSTMMSTSDSVLIGADFDRLVINESKCLNLLLFRLAENVTAIVVHKKIKDEVEKRGIEGLFFYPSGQWSG